MPEQTQPKSTRQIENESLREDLNAAFALISEEERVQCKAAAQEMGTIVSKLNPDIAALAIGFVVVSLQEEED